MFSTRPVVHQFSGCNFLARPPADDFGQCKFLTWASAYIRNCPKIDSVAKLAKSFGEFTDQPKVLATFATTGMVSFAARPNDYSSLAPSKRSTTSEFGLSRYVTMPVCASWRICGSASFTVSGRSIVFSAR